MSPVSIVCDTENNRMEASNRGESIRKAMITLMKLVGRIAAVVPVSPTDEAFVDRDGFGRAYRIRTTHGSLYFSGKERF